MSQTSAQLKLGWGIKRIEALSREARTFEDSNAYTPRVERDVRSPQEIEYRVFAIENQAPSPDWPLMAGEAIQSLRAALDHAVYAAAKGRGKTQFPIFTDPCEFQVKGRPMIRGLPKAVRALIEERQPYKRTVPHPALDPLAVLSRLSNLDKHRTLATVACAIDLPWVGVKAHVNISWRKVPTADEPLSHDTEVAAFTATTDTVIKEVDVDPRFTYAVRIEGRPLIETLVDLASSVYEAVTECETGRPMPIFARYPIQQPLPGRHLDGTPI